MHWVNVIRKSACVIFLSFLLLGLMNFGSYLFNNRSFDRNTIEEYFTSIAGRQYYIDIYGFTQKMLGKRQIENFTIFKLDNGKLAEPREAIDEKEIELKIKEMKAIFNFLKIYKIPFLIIDPPLPIADEDSLPYGIRDSSHKNADKLHSILSDYDQISVTNIVEPLPESLFYKTDHHWNGDICFKTYFAAAEWMEQKGVLREDDRNITEKSFRRKEVGGFLGSYGVKVGPYYTGKEAYIYYEPLFRTDIEFYACSAEGECVSTHKGNWNGALMDSSILKDETYLNKYNASLWGNSGINRIVNNLVDEGKLLIISHSYGRPLAQYCALDFHEVRQIDPQTDRFKGNYITYIRKYKPDAVLFLCELEGQIIGDYNTDN